MATLVSFQAHPDDESIGASGTLARAAADGHRVVLVFGTRGEQGEPVPGVLAEGEQLWERRVVECHRSADVIGVHRVEFLGYEDSGMMGEPTNDNPACFWQADLDEAAARLATILREEGADVLTVYDDHGGYGHPDHIQIHRVGVRAAELAGTPRVFAGTMNRDRFAEMRRNTPREVLEEAGLVEEFEELEAEMEKELESDTETPNIDEETFGEPEAAITHAIDVVDLIPIKRKSMEAHASQISDDSFFMKMPDEMFAVAFGTEWFIDLANPRPPGAPFGTDLLADLD